jgi:hypothetical protein
VASTAKLDICNRAVQKLGGPALANLNGTDIYTVAVLRVYEDAIYSELRQHNWNFAIRRTSIVAPYVTITAITAAEPPVLTYTGTDPSNGDRVYIEDVVGMTDVNGVYYRIANINTTSNTFELTDTDTGDNIDGTGFTAYTSGGTATICPYWGWNRKFALPSDYIRLIEIDGMLGTQNIAGGIGHANDYNIEGRYIVCNDSGPIFIRYVAQDLTVTDMDVNFIELAACRVALECSVEIKQSDVNYQKLLNDYSRWLNIAKRADSIETPGEILPESSWLTARF